MKSGDVKMAATLFVLMGEETAAEVLRHLNEAEIEAISREISTVGPIASEEAEKSAAELLESLPEDIQADVAVRMASMETISPEVIRGISAVLEEKLKPVGTYAHNQAYGGIRAVAELLNRIERRKSRAVLEKIDSTKP